eukprot:TRINITY_DN37948_c0_g1_i1.p1 TRINITY_DN37948_c0_g1~~TRINITY_DN37948_c0_g1_i1.p1  ORF type:complete len:232 (-),score=43.32 TRINITY_DN37948_c0_g1_i1:59-754(-)
MAAAMRVHSLYCEEETLSAQVLAFHRARLAVAVEGACLANVLWMKAPAAVIEFGLGASPPHEVLPKNECGTTYAAVVAAAVGVRFYSLLDLAQDFKAGKIDAQLSALRALVKHALKAQFPASSRHRHAAAAPPPRALPLASSSEARVAADVGKEAVAAATSGSRSEKLLAAADGNLATAIPITRVAASKRTGLLRQYGHVGLRQPPALRRLLVARAAIRVREALSSTSRET